MTHKTHRCQSWVPSDSHSYIGNPVYMTMYQCLKRVVSGFRCLRRPIHLKTPPLIRNIDNAFVLCAKDVAFQPVNRLAMFPHRRLNISITLVSRVWNVWTRALLIIIHFSYNRAVIKIKFEWFRGCMILQYLKGSCGDCFGFRILFDAKCLTDLLR